MKKQRITRITRTVYTTEEFTGLQSAVEQAGGRIVGTTSLRNGAGINVEIQLGEGARNF